MSKRRGGSLPRVMPPARPSGLTVRMVVPGLPITAPDPLAVSLGGCETAGLQLAADLAGAILQDANLESADLTGATVETKQLEGACGDERTKPTEPNMRRCQDGLRRLPNITVQVEAVVEPEWRSGVSRPLARTPDVAVAP
jgi:hypothetical protein